MEGSKAAVISIIIPTLNEARRIETTLASTSPGSGVELIVVDGGSRDDTIERANDWNGTRVLRSEPGRARQMNLGAGAATGTYLLFLHADTRVLSGFDGHVRAILSRPGVAGGAFRFEIDGSSRWFRLIEKVANWRSRCLQLPYGDQGIFVGAELFRKVGGFPELPIMEDFELVRRLGRHGRIAIAPVSAPTSARRWQQVGPLRTTLINQAIILGYAVGLDLKRLANWYQRRMSPPRHSGIQPGQPSQHPGQDLGA